MRRLIQCTTFPQAAMHHSGLPAGGAAGYLVDGMAGRDHADGCDRDR